MSDLTNRRRTREEPHVRSIQEQTLDALLRIEEQVERLRVDYLRLVEKPVITADHTVTVPKGSAVETTKPGGVSKVFGKGRK